MAAGCFALLCLCGCGSAGASAPRASAPDERSLHVEGDYFTTAARRAIVRRYLEGDEALLDDAVVARLLLAARPGRPRFVVVGHGPANQDLRPGNEAAGRLEQRLHFTLKLIRKEELVSVAEGTVLPLELTLIEMTLLPAPEGVELGPGIAGYRAEFGDVSETTLRDPYDRPLMSQIASAIVCKALTASDWISDSDECDYIWLFPDENSPRKGELRWDRVSGIHWGEAGLFPPWFTVSVGRIDIHSLRAWTMRDAED